MIYRIESRENWEAALSAGELLPGDYDSEGFIHCSALDQIKSVAERVHPGEQELVLLCISQKLLHGEVRWEPAGDGLYYPHVYGPINTSAVVAALPFTCNLDGTFTLPPGMPDDAGDQSMDDGL